MPASDYPTVMQHLSAQRAERFDTVVETLERGRDAGEIPNSAYTDAKLPLSRSIERAWEVVIERPFLHNRDYPASAEEREAMDAFSGVPAPHLMKTFDRRAAALGETEAGRATRAFLDEVRPLMDLMAHCKTIAVKRQAKAPQARPSEIYSAPAASGTAMAHVHAVLQEITAEARNQLFNLVRKQESGIVRRYMSAQEEKVSDQASGSRRGYSPYEYARDVGKGQVHPYVRDTLDALVVGRYRSGLTPQAYTPREDCEEILDRRATKTAENLCADFIDRNLAKLASIIEAKGDFSRIEAIGRRLNPAGMDGQMRVHFKDESSFEVRTSVVWSISSRGTPFPRFPTTFHDVRMPDGEVMAKMSEQEMNEVFAVARPEAPAPEDDDAPSM